METLKLCFFVLLLSNGILNSQNLDAHTWENRVLLLLSETKEDKSFQEQLHLLLKEKEGLLDRKLLVYQTLPGTYSMDVKNGSWKTSKKLYQDFKKSNTPFEVILIGLDGSEKLRQDTVIMPKELFALIDAMPMRANELRKRKKNQ